MIQKPTLLLNEAICRSNIEEMAAKARRNRVVFRPHFKTHQSHEIGRWFQEVGVTGITVSSLEMAQYFAADGWTDITLAFPVNLLEIDGINALAAKIHLNLLVESVTTIQFLSQQVSAAVSLFVKIDTGYGRTGIEVDNTALIDAVLNEIALQEHLSFAGFLTHAGHSYSARGTAQIAAIHQDSMTKAVALKTKYLAKYPDLILSVGDTPCCSRMEDFSGADEMRPGNFVFYDLMQHQIGSNRIEDIAVAMVCPIVANHPHRNEVLIYGGGVHFSKDRIVDSTGRTIFGQVVDSTEEGWGAILEGAYLKKLSQEHGTVHVPDAYLERFKIGGTIKILPIHSCMAANLMKAYLTTTGTKISRL